MSIIYELDIQAREAMQQFTDMLKKTETAAEELTQILSELPIDSETRSHLAAACIKYREQGELKSYIKAVSDIITAEYAAEQPSKNIKL